MTDADLERIESELGVTLPEAYKRFQRSYPDALSAVRESGWEGDPEDMYWLFYRPEHVVLYTKSNRESMPVTGEAGEAIPWPRNYLVIGRQGTSGGDFFCLDVTYPDDSVWVFLHEEGCFYLKAKSLAEYAARLQLRFCP